MEGSISFWGYKEQESNLILPEHDDDDDDDEVFCLNPICHFLALLGAQYTYHVSRIKVKMSKYSINNCCVMFWSWHNLHLNSMQNVQQSWYPCFHLDDGHHHHHHHHPPPSFFLFLFFFFLFFFFFFFFFSTTDLLVWLPFWASQHNHLAQDEVVSLMPNRQPWRPGSGFAVCCTREVGKILRNPSYALGHSVWLLCWDLSSLNDPTHSYATESIASRCSGAYNPPRPV